MKSKSIGNFWVTACPAKTNTNFSNHYQRQVISDCGNIRLASNKSYYLTVVSLFSLIILFIIPLYTTFGNLAIA